MLICARISRRGRRPNDKRGEGVKLALDGIALTLGKDQ